MHEAGVTERILEIVLEHAKEAHAERVTDVYLEIGEESGIDRDSVELHWPLLAEDLSLRARSCTSTPRRTSRSRSG